MRFTNMPWCVARRLHFLQSAVVHQRLPLLIARPFLQRLPASTCVQIQTHHFHNSCSLHHSGSTPPLTGRRPTSSEIRQTFLEFFKRNNHLYVHSSSVIPEKDAGTYFVNAGMNQFKPIFLGTVSPDTQMASYRRITNSQKCIRVGGKHNDLDDVGKDTYHHTFFEMLGSWSFGDYFKREICKMAWELLTEVYALPKERLYVTYFGGNEALGLDPDLECRDIWLELGVPKERVLPFGMEDNFWDMGETGPCGPCTEIHYDHIGQCDASSFVNVGVPDVIELWNLVFMQFDRQKNGSLLTLPAQHVDTGMGLERIVAVLQGQMSNYDTDLFLPLFSAIQEECHCPKYQGRLGRADTGGVDTAYRVVADHARMFTVAIGDGLLPGRSGLNFKLRSIIHRCIKESSRVLRAPPGLAATLVPLVVESLGDAFPELRSNPQQIVDVVSEAEQRYTELLKDGQKTLRRALGKYGNVAHLSGEQLIEMHEGRFGRPLPVDILVDVAQDAGIGTDAEELESILEKMKEKQATVVLSDDLEADNLFTLSQQDVQHLKESGVALTEDSYKYEYTSNEGVYDFQPLTGNVVALKHDGKFVDSVEQGEVCGIVLDQTSFYAGAGGQVADLGYMKSDQGTKAVISDVQLSKNYVVHKATIESGTLRVGDTLELVVDAPYREGCMRNHTATHILNFALDQVLGNVHQMGSTVNSDKLTLNFSYTKRTPVTLAELEAVSQRAHNIVSEQLPVYREVVELTEAKKINGIRLLKEEVYPNQARVVSIGTKIRKLLKKTRKFDDIGNAVELCGGLHVDNTGDILSLVITNLTAVAQGTKKATAVTGATAQKCIEEGRQLRDKLSQLETWIELGENRERWVSLAQEIEKQLFDGPLLAKTDRDYIKGQLEKHGNRIIRHMKKKSAKEQLLEEITEVVKEQAHQDVIFAHLPFLQARDVVSTMAKVSPSRPTMVACIKDAEKQDGKTCGEITAVCYMPKGDDFYPCEEWTSAILKEFDGVSRLSGGKNLKHTNIRILTVKIENTELISKFKDVATVSAKTS